MGGVLGFWGNQLLAEEPILFAIQSKGVFVDIFDTFSDLGHYFS